MPDVETTERLSSDQRVTSALSMIQGGLGKPAPAAAPDPEPHSDAEPTQSDDADAQQPVAADPEAQAEGDEPTPEDDGPTEEPETETFWYEGETSRYRTEEEAKRGIGAKDEYIAQLTSENETLRSQVSVMDRYKTLVSADQVRAARVKENLPEEYRDASEEDFDNDDDLRKFLRARLEAELRIEAEDGENERKAKEEAQAQAAARDAAKAFMDETISPTFFEVTNPEDKKALVDVLDAKDENGYSKLDYAQWIAQYMGREAATVFLTGVRTNFHASRRSSVHKVIKERVDTKPAAPVAPAPPAAPKEAPKPSSREMIAQGLRTTAPRTR